MSYMYLHSLFLSVSLFWSLSLFLSGLSPAWLLQYVLVKDLQTGSSYFFLVEEWLSVDNEKTDGRVEIEAEPSGKTRSLSLFIYLFICLRGFPNDFFRHFASHPG